MLGFKSVSKAEEAAYNGEGEGAAAKWDSQGCRDYQQIVLSSPRNNSPPREKRNAIASNLTIRLDTIVDHQNEDNEDHEDDGELQLDLLPPDWQAQDHPEPEPVEEVEELAEPGLESPLLPSKNTAAKETLSEVPSTAEDPPHTVPDHHPNGTQEKKVIGRDSKGRLRLFQGNIVAESTTRRIANKNMDEDPNSNGTQKSSMSLTQENPESAYAVYKRTQVQSSANNSSAAERNPLFPNAYGNSKNQSLFTDSTAHTYRENDTGHIDFDLEGFGEDSKESKIAEDVMEDEQEMEDEPEMDQEESQEVYSPAKFETQLPPPPPDTSYAPETPAPVVNPFGNKGNIMKPFELFGATQASSAVRAAAYSPTSSRPSPNLYNELATPGLLSSPTEQRGANQASSPPIIASTLSQSPAFRTAPENPQTSPVQPRAYNPMKEGQDRRRTEEAETEDDFNSGSDGSVSSVEAVAKKKRQRIDRFVAREQSAVIIFPATVEKRKSRTSSKVPSSPSAAATSVIEVPSTSKNSEKAGPRRRSIQDDYLAQCTGSEARDTQQNTQQDTQQDDVIADSQSLPLPEPDAEFIVQSVSHIAESSLPQPSTHYHPSSVQVLAPSPDPNQDQKLPHIQDENVDDPTIPETSPILSGRIRPMADIASFRADSSEDAGTEQYPGFSQDWDFDEAIGVGGRARQNPSSKHLLQSGTEKISSAPEAVIFFSNENLESAPDVASAAPLFKKPFRSFEPIITTPQEGKYVGVERNNSSLKVPTPLSSTEPFSSALSSPPEMDTDDEYIVAAPEINNVVDDKETPVSSDIVPPNMEDLPILPASTPVVAKGKGKGLITYGRGSSSSKKTRRAKSSSPGQDDLASASPSIAAQAQRIKVPPKKRAVARKSLLPKALPQDEPPVTTQPKKASKRKSTLGPTSTEGLAPTRSSKRKSIGHNLRDSSEDPIALDTHPTSSNTKKNAKGLFSGMAFAVSYVSADAEKDKVTTLLRDNGARILEDGFDSLFNKTVVTSSADAEKLQLLPSAEKIGFVALIANQHSRRAKYIQALALGLPCISGKWVSACLAKDCIIDWSLYLLCAGQSALLGDACRSRTLQYYSATDAKIVETFEQRDQFMKGRSILIVTGNAKRLESRKAYVFLMRALGPGRVGYSVDLQEARNKLVEGEKEGNEWDIVYVDIEKGAEVTLFEDVPTATVAGASRKRKRASTAASDTPAPKRIRVISDETVVQSLILGQLVEG